MAKLIEPELSYRVVGILFEVYNRLGGGYQEKYYQKAIALALRRAGIKFIQQAKADLFFGDSQIGRFFIDFVIENKIVLEIKSGTKIYKRDFKQVRTYLKKTCLELGIIALFTKIDLRFYRVLYPKN